MLNIWRAKVQRPGVRIYQTKNFYGVIREAIYDEEVLGIGSEVREKAPGKGK